MTFEEVFSQVVLKYLLFKHRCDFSLAAHSLIHLCKDRLSECWKFYNEFKSGDMTELKG